jgi:hypothetical protein
MKQNELKKINTVYKNIKDLGLSLEITKQRGNIAYMYLLDNNGKRITKAFPYIEKLTKENFAKGEELFIKARHNSHRENAMKQCFNYFLNRNPAINTIYQLYKENQKWHNKLNLLQEE